MFVYNQSEAYGKDPEMRHSHGHTNKLTSSHGNNNNSSISNHHNVQREIPFCNIETAFNHCTNVNTIGSPWTQSKISNLRSSVNSSPTKNKIIPRPILCNAKYAAVPLTDPSLPFFDDESSYVPRNLGQSGATTSRGNNNSHLYQQIRHYYSGASSSPRQQQYAHNNGVPASQQDLTKFSPVPRNKDERKRQTKPDRNQYYTEDGSDYSMHGHMDEFMQSSWSTVISDRSSRLPSADQHYEHYFSYFYNRGKDQLPKKKTHNPVCTYKPMSLFPDTPSKRSQCKPSRITSNDNNNKNGEYDSYIVLNENNEMPFGYNDNEWVELDDVPEKPDITCNDVYEPKDYTNDDQFDPNFMQSTQRQRFVQQHSENNELKNIKHTSEDTLTSNGNHNNNNNNNNNTNTRSIIGGSKKVLKATTESCSQPRSHAALQSYPRLPLTPKRVRGGLPTAKKILPTVHRVLLYNSQSPRLTRKHHSTNSRNQNVKAPHPKGQSGGQDQASDHATKYIFDDSELKDVEKKEFRDVDFDNDDDLDNISNFDESDTVSLGSDTEDGYRAHAYKMAHSSDRLSSSPKNSLSLLLSQSSDEDLRTPSSVLVPSLFPYVPPYISFSSNAAKGPDVPAELHRILKWRVTSIMPKVVRLILANSGMRMLKKTNDWMGVWGKHLKSPCFKTIRSYQKINHLPGSFRIGRKDSCWKNLQRQMRKHSNREFGFMPRTYVIPNDLGALRKRWPVYAQRNTKWIIKPPASARGAGIRVVNRWGQIPKRRPLIVQKYIERPLLINGSKFDLRLYVLVTSVNPLRVFMYHNGLARFASVKYSAKIDTLNDRCMHLTNYSINKFSSNYSKNEDVNACHGHKWTIKSLWNYLANRGVRTDGLWEALRSLVLRTILAGENGINSMMRANVESKYSCFELFGFDVILDSDLVPWLLEVNISPSLHSELPLDAHVKAPLVQGVLNTALYNIPPKLTSDKQKELAAEFCFPPGTQMCYDKRLYINYLSRDEKLKHQNFTRKNMENREEYINAILEKLTPDDVRCLIVAEDELARCAPLERIFPTDQTYKYLKYNDQPRYYNRLLDAWESRYGNNRTEGIALLRDHCQTKYHLQVPVPPAKKDSSASPNDDNVRKPACDGEEDSETPLHTKKITMNSEACKKKHNQLEEN